jgi:hypothetical protein
LHETGSDNNDGISKRADSEKFEQQKDVNGHRQFAELQRALQNLVALSQEYVKGECHESEWRSAVDEVTEALQTLERSRAKHLPKTR